MDISDKKQIIQMINEIKSQEYIDMIYGFVNRIHAKEKEFTASIIELISGITVTEKPCNK